MQYKLLSVLILLFISCGGGFQSENEDAGKFEKSLFKKKTDTTFTVISE